MNQEKFTRILSKLNANQMQVLDLSGEGITYEQISELTEIIKNSTSLTALDLRENYIRDAGAKLIADAIKGSASLTKVDLSVNKIGAAGAGFIAARQLTHPRKRDLAVDPGRKTRRSETAALGHPGRKGCTDGVNRRCVSRPGGAGGEGGLGAFRAGGKGFAADFSAGGGHRDPARGRDDAGPDAHGAAVESAALERHRGHAGAAGIQSRRGASHGVV